MADLKTSSGSTLAIGTTAAADDAASFALDTYTAVGVIEDLGEFGDSSEIINFLALSDARVRKTKGPRDAGDLNLVVGEDPDDTGQAAMEAAEAASDAYNIRIERDDGTTTPTTYYFRAFVTSSRRVYGTATNVQRVNFNLAIDKLSTGSDAFVVVAAT